MSTARFVAVPLSLMLGIGSLAHAQDSPILKLEARRVAMGRGLRHVYTGNIHDEGSQATFCHACGAVLIGRDWHRITAWSLTEDGRCRQCGERCPGVFEGPRPIGPVPPIPGAGRGPCRDVDRARR